MFKMVKEWFALYIRFSLNTCIMHASIYFLHYLQIGISSTLLLTKKCKALKPSEITSNLKVLF